MTPKVYFTDFCTGTSETLPQKLSRLILTAGIDQIDFKDKFVAIKIHFGELGNMAHLRSGYARVLVDIIKDLGGKPFLTDCNTMYVGSRKNALDHLETAYLNGFTPYSTGCHVIIGDGLKGTDDVDVPVEGGEYVKCAKIGRAIMDADIVISLNHFKGHEEAGFGGAMKNLGMGCGSNAGKREMHSEGRPEVDAEKCVGCGTCAKYCAHGGPVLENGVMHIDWTKCMGCGRCIGACNRDAIQSDFGEPCTAMHGKIAEYTAAVVRGKTAFHVSFICDVSPHCDCHPMNDVPLIPDLGMAASLDPVALDKACADLCNEAPLMPGCCLAGRETNGDLFATMHPVTRWQDAVAEGARMGLGTKDYELKRI